MKLIIYHDGNVRIAILGTAFLYGYYGRNELTSPRIYTNGADKVVLDLPALRLRLF